MPPPEEIPATRRQQQRVSPRFRYFGAIFLSWTGPRGKNAVMGRCFDISANGLGVEVAARISVGTEVTVRAEWVNLNSSATVRHIAQKGGAFQLGLELDRSLPPELLKKLVLPDSESS